MKSEKDIGKLIAERISQAEVEQPNNLMWKAIEKTLKRRRFVRLGLISVSTILVLTSLSYFFIFPTIQETNNKKPKVPKEAKASKNNSPDGNQTPINSSHFKDSIYNQSVVEEDTSSRKPFFTQTKSPVENPKKNGKEIFPDGKPQEALRNPEVTSNDNEKVSRFATKKIDDINSSQKKGVPAITETNGQDLNKNSNETVDIVQQDDPKTAEKSSSLNKEMDVKQSVDKDDEYPDSIAVSDSLKSKRSDSLTSKKSNRISKIDRKLKENAIDSADFKKKSNLEYYFLPVANTSLYGRLKDKSTIDFGLDGNEKNSNLRYGFGGYVMVRMNSKFEIRLGVQYSNYSKKTFNVNIIPNDNSTNYYTNVDFANGLNYGSFSNSFSQPARITLQEELAYLEFPIDFGYKVWEKSKWSVDLIAGASAAILIENRLNALTESDDLIFLGKNRNYSENILSIRLGTGVYYNFSDYLALRLEVLSKPTFGTFQTSQGDNPILLNANFGIAIRL